MLNNALYVFLGLTQGGFTQMCARLFWKKLTFLSHSSLDYHKNIPSKIYLNLQDLIKKMVKKSNPFFIPLCFKTRMQQH